jgi:hypothetical protein
MAQRRVIVCLVGGLLGLSSVLEAAAAPGPDAPKERRLHVASAEASSYLVNDWNKFQENYLPLYVGDDDPKTAWTLKTEGIGESLRVHVTPMAGATKVRLRIRNGYQKSDKLWAANSRAKGLIVVLLPSKKTVDVELTDTKGWQEIAVEQPAGAFEAVELRVRSVYAGKKYDDLCLSDVEVFVTATTPDNPAFEKQRLQKILDWKNERLAAAELFKSELGKSLPVASQYTFTPAAERKDWRGDDTCNDWICFIAEHSRHAAELEPKAKPSRWEHVNQLLHDRFAGMTPVRISTQDKRPTPLVDGACTPGLAECIEDPCFQSMQLPRELGYLNAHSLVTTEQTGLPSVADLVAIKPAQCKRAEPTTFAYVDRWPASELASPGPIRAVLLVTCGMVAGREGSYPAAFPELLSYRLDGRLDTLATRSAATAFDWSKDSSAPRLASAQRTTSWDATPARFEAATTIVAGE